MCLVPITAYDEFPALVAHFLQVRRQQFIEFVLARQLLRVTWLCIGGQQAAYAEVLIVGLDIAAFHVEIGEAQSGHDGLGQFATVDRHPVGLAVNIVQEVGIVILGKVDVILQVVLGAAQILHANKIGVLLCQPVVESFCRGIDKAVSTETDNSHSWLLPMRACMISSPQQTWPAPVRWVARVQIYLQITAGQAASGCNTRRRRDQPPLGYLVSVRPSQHFIRWFCGIQSLIQGVLTAMLPYQIEFINLARQHDVLKFGEFTLKSGRISPYFFNAGAFACGEALAALGRCYARRIVDSGVQFDILLGPAYKGIPLATATAIALADNHDINVPFAYNRKEAKSHGEGGVLVGAPLQGRVLVIDDVITAGTAVREVIAMIEAAGARLAGVAVGLNRQERGEGERSAIQEVEEEYGVPVLSIIDMEHIIAYLEDADMGSADPLEAMKAYRARYGV